MAKVTKAEYQAAKDFVNSQIASGNVSKTDEGGYKINTGDKAGTTISSKGVVTPAPTGSSNSSSGSTGSGLTNKTTTTTDTSSGLTEKSSSAGDVYGDVSKNRGATSAMDFANYNKISDEEFNKVNVYGQEARELEGMEGGSLAKRNDYIANDLYSKGLTSQEDVEKYLSQQKGFTNFDDADWANTRDAITARLSAVAKKGAEGTSDITEGGKTDTDLKAIANDFNADGVEDKEGFYYDKNSGEYFKAYGYDSWSKELQNEFDRLPDDKKKEVSNMGAQELQEYLKLGDDYLRTKEYLEKQHGIAEDLYENQHRQATIQMEQTLRKAEEGYNNLKQNWQYLGNMGMPGVSATRIEAIGDAITEAKKTLGEIQELEALKMDAMEMQWDQQVLQYSKQIDDLTNDLKWRTSQEFVDAINKFNSAELEGNLDTIDGITAFRRELLDQMDKNLSGITNQSLNQMQYITQQYQDVADKMYKYAENKNVVNKDLSTVKGYYVDGNGNAILNDKGMPIEVPQGAPLDPVFDKESGKLITFGYDENGGIKANVQQLWSTSQNTPNAQYISMLSKGASVSDILKEYPNADINTLQTLAENVKPDMLEVGGYQPNGTYKRDDLGYRNASDMQDTGIPNVYGNGNVKLAPGVSEMFKSVYDSLAAQGIELKIGDSYRSYETQKAAYESGKAGVADPNKSFHVKGQAFDVSQDGSMYTKEVTQALLDAGFTRPAKGEPRHWSYGEGPDVFGGKPSKGYFDQLQSAGIGSNDVNEAGFKPTMVGYYDKFLSGKFTTEDTKQYNTPQFQQELAKYKQYKEAQATDYTKQVLASLYSLQEMSSFDYLNAMTGMPMTDGRKYRKDYDTLMSNLTLESLVNAKQQNISFGALSDVELGMIGDAKNNIDFTLKYGDFEDRVDKMIAKIEKGLIENGAEDVLNQIKAEAKSTEKKKVPGGNR